MTKKQHNALVMARAAIQAVIYDERTKEAGLWLGPMLPRTLKVIEDALLETEKNEQPKHTTVFGVLQTGLGPE